MRKLQRAAYEGTIMSTQGDIPSSSKQCTELSSQTIEMKQQVNKYTNRLDTASRTDGTNRNCNNNSCGILDTKTQSMTSSGRNLRTITNAQMKISRPRREDVIGLSLIKETVLNAEGVYPRSPATRDYKGDYNNEDSNSPSGPRIDGVVNDTDKGLHTSFSLGISQISFNSEASPRSLSSEVSPTSLRLGISQTSFNSEASPTNFISKVSPASIISEISRNNAEEEREQEPNLQSAKGRERGLQRHRLRHLRRHNNIRRRKRQQIRQNSSSSPSTTSQMQQNKQQHHLHHHFPAQQQQLQHSQQNPSSIPSSQCPIDSQARLDQSNSPFSSRGVEMTYLGPSSSSGSHKKNCTEGFEGLKRLVPSLCTYPIVSNGEVLSEATRYIEALKKKIEDKFPTPEGRHDADHYVRARLAACRATLTKEREPKSD